VWTQHSGATAVLHTRCGAVRAACTSRLDEVTREQSCLLMWTGQLADCQHAHNPVANPHV
jgi:hypothetical protein